MFGAPHVRVRRLTARVCMYLAVPVATAAAAASDLPATGSPALRPIREVLALSADDLTDGVTVRIRGIVTASGGATCAQDADAGIWFRPAKEPPSSPPPADDWTPARQTELPVGMDAEIIGVVRRGLYAPTLESIFIRKLGHAGLPPPIPVDAGRLFRGGDNALRVEVGRGSRAIVQGCRDTGNAWTLVLDVASRRIAASVAKSLVRDRPDHLIDAEVRLVGVVGAVRNSRGEFVAPVMSVGDASDIVVVKPAPTSPFDSPRVSLSTLATYRPEPFDGHRVWTEGIVTCVVPGRFCHIQDGATGIHIDCPEARGLQVGDRVRAAGFIEIHRGTAGMVEAIVERLGSGAPPDPAAVAPTAICALIRKAYDARALPRPSDYANTLIRFPATLVERQRTGDGWTLTLSDKASTTVARLPDSSPEDDAAVARIAIGSALAVTGIALINPGAGTEPLTGVRLPDPADVELLLRSAADLSIVRPPSWWTPRRLGMTAAALATVLTAAAIWVILLRRQVAIQARRIAAEQQSRHDAAVEFQATLRERNRLAANLHDTVLQTVTGIGYQLTACTGDDGHLASDAGRHFGLVERMVKHAVLQLRGTVWALRATSPVNRTLPEALNDLATRLGDEHDTTVHVDIEAALPPVPDFVAGNLLLIAQEAVLNALRHARATTISLVLRVDAEAGLLRLMIRDDGCGFETGNEPGPRQGHFGLDGIRERSERIGARLSVESRPREGTTVTTTVPLNQFVVDHAATPSDRTVTLMPKAD